MSLLWNWWYVLVLRWVPAKIILVEAVCLYHTCLISKSAYKTVLNVSIFITLWGLWCWYHCKILSALLKAVDMGEMLSYDVTDLISASKDSHPNFIWGRFSLEWLMLKSWSRWHGCLEMIRDPIKVDQDWLCWYFDLMMYNIHMSKLQSKWNSSGRKYRKLETCYSCSGAHCWRFECMWCICICEIFFYWLTLFSCLLQVRLLCSQFNHQVTNFRSGWRQKSQVDQNRNEQIRTSLGFTRGRVKIIDIFPLKSQSDPLMLKLSRYGSAPVTDDSNNWLENGTFAIKIKLFSGRPPMAGHSCLLSL